MFGLGPLEILVILVFALLLFGRRLPEVGRGVGKSIVEFKKGLAGIEDELRVDSSAASHPQDAPKTPAAKPASQLENNTPPTVNTPSAQETTTEKNPPSQN